MKIFFVVALLVAGINAIPSTTRLSSKIDFTNERLVTDAIASAIQDASQAIKDAGLDPLHISHLKSDYALPVPVLFNYALLVEEFLSEGLSNIVINNLSFSLITNRLTFDISLPLIEVNLEKAETDVTFFGEQYEASASGRLAIVNIRVSGNVRVSIGIITGISIRSITINFSLGGIQSALNVVVQNWDLSNFLNTFLGVTIPGTLNEFSAEINQLLEIIALDIAEGIL